MSTEFINDQWRLPNAWNGTESNVNKQSNYSMSFDSASSDYIDVGNDVSLQFSSSFTISAWVKIDLNDTGNNAIISKDSSASNGAGYHISFRTGNSVHAWSYDANSKLTATGLTTNTWYHIVFIFESTGGSNGNQSLYINAGTPVTNTITNFAASTIKNLRIGESEVLSGYNTNGQIDAVSIYNYALSSSQVTTLYGSSSTGIGNPMSLSPKPVAYYPLGDQDAFNGASYLTPNASLKDYVFDFDAGSSQYISTPASISGVTSFTISAWANAETLTTADTLVGQWRNGNTSNSAFLMYLVSNTMHFYIGSGSSAILAGGDTTLSTGQWYHFCATWDGTTTKLYINGVQESTTGSASSMNTTTVDLLIGAYNNSAGTGVETAKTWNGKISNAQIFNTALPATGSNSVETLYNNGTPLTSMSGFSSLQGWWKLDASATYDSSTTTWSIPDDSTNSNDGTSSGMTQANLVQSDLSFKTSISPFALDFDGTNDYIDCGNDSSLSFSTSFSLSVWINNWSNDGNCVAMKGDGASYGYFLFAPHPSDLNKFKVWIKTSNNWYNATNDIGFSDNTKWVNLVVCYNSIDNSLVLYSNGVSGSVTTTAGTLLTGTQNFKFGVENNTTSFYNGSISNASIWNTELTSAQVTEIYNEGVPSNLNNHSAYSNLVSWWQLGSNSSFNTNWTVLDEKGSNNGTSSNMGEDAIVDGVGSYANGLSSGMGGDEVIGDAPYSTANSLSVNMDVEDRVTDTPS